MHPVGGCIKKPHGNHVDLIVFQVYTYGFKSAVLHSSLLGVYIYILYKNVNIIIYVIMTTLF